MGQSYRFLTGCSHIHGVYPILSENFLKAHWDVAERAGLLSLQPFVDASQVEMMPALGPNLWVVCSMQPESA